MHQNLNCQIIVHETRVKFVLVSNLYPCVTVQAIQAKLSLQDLEADASLDLLMFAFMTSVKLASTSGSTNIELGKQFLK